MLPTLTESRSLHRRALSEAARLAWLADASKLRFPDPCEAAAWRESAEESVTVAERHLREGIADALDEFFSPAGADAMVLENLPVDRHLPPAPSDGKRPASKSAVSEAVIAGLIEGHASIVSYT